MYKNITHKFYSIGKKTCPFLEEIEFWRIDETTLYLKAEIPDSVLNVSIEIVTHDDIPLVQSSYSTSSFPLTIPCDIGETYKIRFKTICSEVDGSWTQWYSEEPPKHYINILTTNAYLYFKDSEKQKYPKDIIFNFMLTDTPGGNRSLWHRLYDESNNNATAYQIFYQSGVWRWAQGVASIHNLQSIPLNVKSTLSTWEIGDTAYIQINNNTIRSIIISEVTSTSLSTTRLFGRIIGKVYPFNAEGEKFDLREGSGYLITGENGTEIDISSSRDSNTLVEGVDFVWEIDY